MIQLRKAKDRGRFDYGWLDTRHTFSFGDYHDPDNKGFGVLRVINEDTVQGGAGFPEHAHWNMEIVTLVLEGALQHQDSMGNGSVIRAGEVQRMTAGTGVTHSEYSADPADPVHFLQIWVIPREKGLAPGYEQRAVDAGAIRNALAPIASPDGGGGAVTIEQDASIHLAHLDAGARVEHALAAGRRAWVHVARGAARLGDHALAAGDGAAVTAETTLALEGGEGGAEVLVFDLPG